MNHGALMALTVLAVGCGGTRSISVTDGAAGPDAPVPCTCSGMADTLGGTLFGQPTRLDHGAYGIAVSFGTHANPINPAAAVGIELLLTERAVDCTPGPEVEGIRARLRGQLVAGVQQHAWNVWRAVDDSLREVDGEFCLLSVPLEQGQQTGPPPEDLADVPGCATLRFTLNDQPAGQASGRFTAQRCPPLDSAWGE